ncbi:electron transfer flavoprotein subunit beta [Desulfosarcina ovata subsp. sediminis]|uniref:Electron transfer flavoprotein subunit beta n=1 Tax=Desulfosarcina ovata subsp. sediminis TaxID=885957 RepID=A0A5K7ZJ09_9BACT|nr:electron transfer flavoprotein subunit beta/FixA family protein [Desulfosarcina ovata]BBO80986.1 electron transfer flavoprotein subunit beta [Desulfosarcina ovata subsp. sediminis]
MHIAVLVKVVPDYEVPAGDFELVDDRAHPRYTRMIGLYDENALETGVQLKEEYQATLSVISYGSSQDIAILRKAVAMGGDSLTLVEGDADDPYVIAANLKTAIENLGDVDLVLAGQQSADMDRGVVPGILAEMLGVTFLPKIAQISKDGDGWRVRQIPENGSRELSFSGKGVLSITSIPENVPRIPAVRAIFAAKKKPVNKLACTEVAAVNFRALSVDIPQMETVCEFLPMDDAGETARTLLTKLRAGRYL